MKHIHTWRARLTRTGLVALALTMAVSTPAWAGKKKPPRPHKKAPQQNSEPLGAPEIDPSLLAGGTLLLVGGTLVLMARRKSAPQS